MCSFVILQQFTFSALIGGLSNTVKISGKPLFLLSFVVILLFICSSVHLLIFPSIHLYVCHSAHLSFCLDVRYCMVLSGDLITTMMTNIWITPLWIQYRAHQDGVGFPKLKNKDNIQWFIFQRSLGPKTASVDHKNSTEAQGKFTNFWKLPVNGQNTYAVLTASNQVLPSKSCSDPPVWMSVYKENCP